MLVKRAGRSRIKDGRGGAAAGISLALHLGVGGLAGAFLHGPGSLLADVGTGDSGSIDVGIEEATLPLEDRDVLPTITEAPKPMAAALEGPAPRARAPKPRMLVAAHRPPAAPLITTAGSTPITSATAAPEEAPPAPRPAETAIHTSPSVPQIAPQPPTSAIVAAAPSPVRAAASASEATRAPRSTPVFLPADVASYLRAQDEFPSLPSSLRHRGAHYQAKLEICVAADGRVTDVGFRSEPAPALDSVLQAAVRGWRYRPFLVDGVATPFCHRMIVSYEIG